MYYYAIFSSLVIAGVMMRMFSGKPILWFAVLGFAVAVGLGNLMAYVGLRKKIAAIFFLNEHFSLISVYEILYKEEEEHHVFPRIYANPRREGDQITVHYHDQIITLKSEDWEDFDLIWNHLTSGA